MSSLLPLLDGYIRHWLVIDTHTAPYKGPGGSENDLRREIVAPVQAAPADCAGLGTEGPYGHPWRYNDPGRNIFVEQSGFWHELSVLNTWGATDLVAEADGAVEGRFWACGAADLWVNGTHVVRHPVNRYMYPDVAGVAFPVRRGRNRLCVRVQALGVRDTRFLFGLQLADPSGFAVALSGTAGTAGVSPAGGPDLPDSLTAAFASADRWLNSVRVSGRDALVGDGPPPVPVTLLFSNDRTAAWPAGANRAVFDRALDRVRLLVDLHGQRIERPFENPSNRATAASLLADVDRSPRAYIEEIAAGPVRGPSGPMKILAARVLGKRIDDDSRIIEESCDWIDGRPDCADFPLSALLRLYTSGALTPDQAGRLRRTALGFRYWQDEPGVDALCFGSENHSLLFHGCQMIAGRLFPDETFTNSGRPGRQQERIGRERCAKWLDQKTERGFHEFLSSTYIPLTAAALLNVVDYCGDSAMSKKAAALVDRLFTVLAEHTFDGVTVGPQGRVYRNVLTPEASGTQAMLAYALGGKVVHVTNDWVAFVAASERYRTPARLADVVAAEVSKTYREAAVQIHLEKTAHYLLTSLEVPTCFQDLGARVAAPQSNPGLIPGRQGYQQHLWHATLARDCHIFVNHPGATFDLSSSRPGFWYGNGTLPRVHQEGGALAQVFDIAPNHPVPFTHAHWPGDVFDESRVDEHWALGRRHDGLVALWCSNPVRLESDVLTDRELRADGRKAAWACLCASVDEHGSLDAFARACERRAPSFDPGSLTFDMEGFGALAFSGRAPEPVPAD